MGGAACISEGSVLVLRFPPTPKYIISAKLAVGVDGCLFPSQSFHVNQCDLEWDAYRAKETYLIVWLYIDHNAVHTSSAGTLQLLLLLQSKMFFFTVPWLP